MILLLIIKHSVDEVAYYTCWWYKGLKIYILLILRPKIKGTDLERVVPITVASPPCNYTE